ncbi:MAG TPA: alpha/beta fold hydrolase [Clostridiales bacterium]|nr:alpha/beta fold hydrolase [Clostridiales bacterium]
MEIIVRSKRVCDIPLLELYENNGVKKKPMVLLYHGYLGRKEFVLIQAYNLACNGFFVVVPDAYGHGERGSGQVIDLFDSIQHSTSEIDNLIDSYTDNQDADNTRVGLAGFSMGGCITFQYIAQEKKKVKAAVPIISTPDWVSIVDNFNTPEKTEELKSLGIIKEAGELAEYRKIAESIQPINRYEMMKDTPLLMLCGAKDMVTPVSGAQRLYELLRPIVADEDALKLVIDPNSAHADTVGMNLMLAEWMKKYLA